MVAALSVVCCGVRGRSARRNSRPAASEFGAVDAGCTFVRAHPLAVPSGIDAGARESSWPSAGTRSVSPRRLRARSGRRRHRFDRAAAQRSRTASTSERAACGSSAGDGDGAFYAFATLAQLARPAPGGLAIPCVRIADAPALRWRVLSDDVSRGPLPTMRYFRERIRTIAAFKMNGYSPYMEHVFVDPKHPLPAPLDGITPAQLRELDAYARRFHVALIPEQQTFAHMHNTLRWERYAQRRSCRTGYLLSPAVPGGRSLCRTT